MSYEASYYNGPLELKAVGTPKKWCKIDVLNLWHPRGKEVGYLYLGESLDDSNVPRSPSSGREDIRYCGNKLSGTKLQIVAAGNWLEHSKVLRSMNVNRAQAVV